MYFKRNYLLKRDAEEWSYALCEFISKLRGSLVLNFMQGSTVARGASKGINKGSTMCSITKP